MTRGKSIPEKTWKKFLEIYADNAAAIVVVCKTLNISTKSYYRKLYDDKVFKDTIDRINDCIHTPMIESVVKRQAIQGDGPSQRFYLSRRGGIRWNDKIQSNQFFQEEQTKKLEEQFTPMDPFTLFSYGLWKTIRRRTLLGGSEELDKLANSLLADLSGWKKNHKHVTKKIKEVEKSIAKEKKEHPNRPLNVTDETIKRNKQTAEMRERWKNDNKKQGSKDKKEKPNF